MPTRMRRVKVEALVLRHSEWGEADRLLTLFTRELGKVKVIAKGVRKIKSKKGGHLQPFTRVYLELASGRDFYILSQADMIDAYTPLREELVKLGQAAYVIELLDRFTYEEGENSALFALAVDTLQRLVEEPDRMLVLRYYEIRLLDFLGFRPRLFQCAGCGREIVAEDQYFSAQEGGVICPRCAPGKQGLRPISVEGLRFLRHFQRSSYPQARHAAPPAPIHQEMDSLMQHYLTYLLERNLNTPAFIRQMRSEGV